MQRYLLQNFGGDVCRRQIEGSVLEAVDFALSGDRVMVLLSPEAAPVVQAGWEEILLHKRVFYVLVRDCRFPPLLQRNRGRFADARHDWLSAQRAAKRWIIGKTAECDPAADEELRRELADRPGFAKRDLDAATRLATQIAAEFEHVCFIDGRGRTLPSVVSEIRDRAPAHSRALIVLRGASRELADAIPVPPFASVLRTPWEQAPAEDTGRVRMQLIDALNSRGDVEEAPLDRALHASPDPEFVRLAALWLERKGRLEEALAALDIILKGHPALSDIARQRSWVAEKLSGAVQSPAPAPQPAEQLRICFG